MVSTPTEIGGLFPNKPVATLTHCARQGAYVTLRMYECT
jgi:hypothetical protein